MSPQRLVAIGAAASIAIAASLWFASQRSSSVATSGPGRPLFPELMQAINEADQVRLEKGDGTRVTMQKSKDGWTVSERTYAADSGRLRKLLLDLANAAVVEEKTSNPASYAAIGVEAPQKTGSSSMRISVRTPQRTFAVLVGKPDGAKRSFVRVEGAAQSLLVAPQLSTEANPQRWLDTSLVDLPAARVQRVDVDGKTAFTAAQGKVKESGNASLAGALAARNFEDVRAQTADWPRNTRRATFFCFDGVRIDVEGREEGERRWLRLAARFDTSQAARSQNSDAATAQREVATLGQRFAGREFEVAAYQYEALLPRAGNQSQ